MAIIWTIRWQVVAARAMRTARVMTDSIVGNCREHPRPAILWIQTGLERMANADPHQDSYRLREAFQVRFEKLLHIFSGSRNTR